MVRFESREVEDALQQVDQHASRPSGGVGQFALSGRQVALQHQLGHAEHAVHRCADLVASDGDEVRFGARVLLGGIASHLEVLLAGAVELALPSQQARGEQDGESEDRAGDGSGEQQALGFRCVHRVGEVALAMPGPQHPTAVAVVDVEGQHPRVRQVSARDGIPDVVRVILPQPVDTRHGRVVVSDVHQRQVAVRQHVAKCARQDDAADAACEPSRLVEERNRVDEPHAVAVVGLLRREVAVVASDDLVAEERRVGESLHSGLDGADRREAGELSPHLAVLVDLDLFEFFVLVPVLVRVRLAADDEFVEGHKWFLCVPRAWIDGVGVEVERDHVDLGHVHAHREVVVDLLRRGARIRIEVATAPETSHAGQARDRSQPFVHAAEGFFERCLYRTRGAVDGEDPVLARELVLAEVERPGC